MRSRYIDPSKERSSEVLLDENYLNCEYRVNCELRMCEGSLLLLNLQYVLWSHDCHVTQPEHSNILTAA